MCWSMSAIRHTSQVVTNHDLWYVALHISQQLLRLFYLVGFQEWFRTLSLKNLGSIISSTLLATSPALHIADILDPRHRSHHRDIQRSAGRNFTVSREFCRRSVDTFAMADSKFYLAEDTLTAPEVATCGHAATPTEMKSDAGQTMKPCLSPQHVDSSKCGPTPYLLSGFGCSSLYERPILFANSLPSGRVCAGCRVVVPARALLLPCGHILCELCRRHLLPQHERACSGPGRQ
ncbi:hypothetical protein HPB49_001027 [Dermacentor silvarum]|uniref:Uncharacterized protein n=1 Tax=Dermacentor silvarum TaxID=543639 RepID=A0ACB8DLF3_DERSI|nr:hypothetical protein HPB49_001027 [Dermacentor silvarum]